MYCINIKKCFILVFTVVSSAFRILHCILGLTKMSIKWTDNVLASVFYIFPAFKRDLSVLLKYLRLKSVGYTIVVIRGSLHVTQSHKRLFSLAAVLPVIQVSINSLFQTEIPVCYFFTFVIILIVLNFIF